jgi:hypothetical protein
VRNFWATLGPTLDLLGWIGLAGAVGFLAWAALERRRNRRWTSAACTVVLMEGQECLVWHSPDGTTHSQLLAGPRPPGETAPRVVYFLKGNQQRWQLTAPEDTARPLRLIGLLLAGVCLLANVLGLVAAF